MLQHRPFNFLAATAVTLIAGNVALAQDTPPPADEAQEEVIDEIVVTAQKREESIQDVPLSIAVLNAATLEKAGVSNVLDMQKVVPNLIVTRAGQAANVRMNIRGIGAAANNAIDPSVGTFVDGVYVPRPGSLLSSFNDMAGIEVARGPQGTLFGRNATVGGILFRTADPSTSADGAASIEVGNYGKREVSGMINIPASDRVSLRLSGLYDSFDGWARNSLDGRTWGKRESFAGRVGLTWDLTDGVKWTVKVDGSKINGDGYVEQELDPATLTAAGRATLTTLFGGSGPDLNNPFDRVSSQRIVGDLLDRQYGAISNLTWDLESGYTVRLISGIRTWENDQVDGDVVYMPRDLASRKGAYDSFSQSHELQLISPVDQLFGGRLDFVAGLYYFEEDFFIGESIGLGADFCNILVPMVAQRPACNASANKATAAVLGFNQDAQSTAIYAQGNIGLADTVDLVLGARFTQDDKRGSFNQVLNNPFAAGLRAPEAIPVLSKDDDQFTYRVGVNWKPNDDMMVFGSYSTGYKSGGFNSGGGAAALGAARRTFNAETSNNFELGIKSTFANGRARLNATVFRMDLNDFQDRAFDGVSFVVANAGNLRQQGLELDGDVAIGEHVKLFAAIGLLDSEFTEYPNGACLPYPTQLNPTCRQDLKGFSSAFSPDLQGSVGAQIEGDFSDKVGYAFRTDISHTDDVDVGGVNDGNTQGVQKAYTLLSARFSLLLGADRNWTLSVFGDNLTDKDYCANRFYQVLDNALGLRDPVSGGSAVRCIVAPPRTYGVGLKWAH